jgi:hypothetical protein
MELDDSVRQREVASVVADREHSLAAGVVACAGIQARTFHAEEVFEEVDTSAKVTEKSCR